MVSPSTAVGEAAKRQGYWLWPFRPTARLAQEMFRLATWSRPLLAGWRWPLTALAVGVLPLGLGFLLGLPLHHGAAAVLLAPLLAACACDDRFGTFLGVVVVAGLAHSALAIVLAAHDPDRSAGIFPESPVYWERTQHWVWTGDNPEYAPSYWVPLHTWQLGGLLASSYLSFGVVPLHNGFRQLDVMNYYVGRLAAQSRDPLLAVAVGWHPWSFLRVVGYALLMYEMVSLSLERFTGRTLSTPRRRLARWSVGLTFCLGDAVLKYLAADWVRQVLYDNLLIS